MRLAPLVAVLLAAPALHAQTDPNPPEAYYPLHVGDQWEYRDYDPQLDPNRYPYERVTVTKDTVVSGRLYFIARTQRFRPWSGTVAESRRVVRFDTASASVMELYNGGASEASLFQCRFDLPVPDGGGSVPCGDNEWVRYSVTTAQIGSGTPAVSVRAIITGGTTRQFAAGIGPVGTSWCEVSCGDVRLEYARVNGVVYGQKIPDFPFEPDTTPAADYYPLEVGNEWIYRYSEQSVLGTSDVLARRRVLREEAVGGQTYAVDQECVYNLLAASPTWTCQPERLVRFDPATTSVVGRSSAGGEYVVVCELGADFGAERTCAPSGGGAGRWVDLGSGPVTIGGAPFTVSRVKVETSLANVSPPAFIAGIGRGPNTPGAFQTSSFEFARVRGVEYGVRPVAGESGAAPAEALALTAAPNPTSGTLRLALTLPEAQTVTAEAFDALGRRVWQATVALPAGAQALALDASAWAPGVYVVRATAGTSSATATVVRR